MNKTVKFVSQAMSFRDPQEEALDYFSQIADLSNFKNQSKEELEKIASENCECHHTVKVDSHFDFVSYCFSMATGIGKTRLMGGLIYYLWKTKGYKHFFILAPGNTIYDKLRRESQIGHPKYLFKGLESEMGNPRIWDGENYTQYKATSGVQMIASGVESEVEVFIFNIGKIFNRGDVQFNFHAYKETLGSSFADILAGFDDLVICMDEAHRYYAPASMKAINYLKPVLGLEFTATPKDINKNIIYTYDITKGAGKYLKIPVVMGRTNMSGYSDKDIEEMKIRDGLDLHEKRKKAILEYVSNHQEEGVQYVKPIVLIACKDTNHAKEVRAFIDSDSFREGKYKGKVIEVHSNMTGEETEENIKLLLSVEKNDNPVEIILHVYKLKEGWDVNNLFTIIPLNAAKSDILALQTIGRGLRLPFGRITGDETIDTLDIVAHEHYRDLVEDIKAGGVFKSRNLDDEPVEETESVKIECSLFDDDELERIEQASSNSGITLSSNLDDPDVQNKLYEEYQKTFGPVTVKPKKKDEDNGQISLFDDIPEEEPVPVQETPKVEPKIKTKEEFVRKIKQYQVKAIQVPRISIFASTTREMNVFVVKRNIKDFDVEASKIERFDAINQELLESISADVLSDPNPVNTLACMLFDEVEEFGSDDAEYILKLVNDYLALIDGTDDYKKQVVRRYASLIIGDISNQIREHCVSTTTHTYKVQKDFICFRQVSKTIKTGGSLPFKNKFTDKQNIRKYIFNGYKKSYYPENAFDSDSERIFSIILEEDEKVVRWIKPPLNQLGIFWRAGEQYNPDFLIETEADKYMVEVKAKKDVRNEEVLEKAKVGIRWCKYASTCDPDKKNWHYLLVADDVIEEGNSLKHTLGLAESIGE